MKFLIVATLSIISIGFAIIVEYKIRKGKLKRVDTYSYRSVKRMGIRGICITIILSIIIYLISNSLEITLSLGIFFLFCVAGGSLYGFFLEYQTKRRRAKRIEWFSHNNEVQSTWLNNVKIWIINAYFSEQMEAVKAYFVWQLFYL